MKPTKFVLALLFGFAAYQQAVAAPEYIANFNSFTAYPYNTAAYKQNNAFVGCGPTTGAMMFGYFQAVHSLTNLLTNPGTGVNTGLNTAWALHGASYMKTLATGFGNVYDIEPGLERYATDKGYQLKVTIHVSPLNTDPNNPTWCAYGPFGDAWTNDAPFYQKNADNTWKIDADKFCDFMALKLPFGIPIFLTIDSDGNGEGDHWVPMVGYDRATKKYAYYDTYSTTLQWADIYYVLDPAGHKINSISMVRTVVLSVPQPDIASNPTSWNYGSINIGNYSDKTFVVSNTGTANLNVTATSLTGTYASDFSIQSGGGAFTLAAGATRNIVVRFTPGAGGARSASLSISSNDPDENPFLISLSGTGTATAPDIASNLTSCSFGSLNLGSAKEYIFIISNTGGSNLNVTATTLTGPNASEFIIPSGGGAFTLAPAATRNLVVRFVPTSAGSKTATLSIASNDPDENPFLISLDGKGLAPDIASNPTSGDFGSIGIGEYQEKTFSVYNVGSASLNVTGVTLTGTNASEFSIRSGGGAFTLTVGGTARSIVVRFTPTSAGSKTAALTFSSDNPDENPFLISLSGEGTTIPPDIASSPTSWNYNAIDLGSYSDKTFVISNQGRGANLVVTSVTLTGTNASEFSIQGGGGSFSLAAGEKRNVTVRFAPTTAGLKSASLSFATNDPDENPFQVNLSGIGGPAPDIASNTISWSYGSIDVGSAKENIFIISNVGNADLNVTSTTITGIVGVTGFEFIIPSGGAPFTLAPGATRNLVVRFVPASAGNKTAQLSIASNDPDENPFLIMLYSNGLAPDIASNPTSGNFESVEIGSAREVIFTISNSGTSNLNITATTITGTNASEFIIPSGGGASTLAPGATRNIVVRFIPTSAGSKSASLSISSNDPDENPFLLILSAVGTAPDITANLTSWNYGSVNVGNHSEKTFSISNTGTANLNVTATTLTGTNASEFSIQSGGGAFTLAPGAGRDIKMLFSPTSGGSKSASLSISSNDPDENPFLITLSGTGGTVPDIASNLTSWNYGSITVGNYSDKTFVISNTGTADLNVTATTLTGTNAQDFGIQSGGGTFTLAPGVTRNIVVRFTPASAGSRSASLSISSNDPDENPFLIALSGTGGAVPDIASNPATGDFGSVGVGGYQERTFAISNVGAATLNVTATTLTGTNASEFSIQSGGGVFSLAAGVSRNIVVRFTPVSAGGKSASLSIGSNDPDENPLLIYLSGTGGALPDIASNPASWNYGSITIGNYSDKTFVISNTGTADLNVTATTLTGTNAQDFSIQSGGGAFTLTPGATRDIVVRFTPASAGSKNASLSISNNDPDENPFLISLSGTGAETAPIILTALNGYHGAVPLAWSAPSLAYLFNIYRGNSQSGSFTLIKSNHDRQYYRDGNISNGQTYYYKVAAVQNTIEVAVSNVIGGTAESNGYTIQSGWAAAAPALDGVINANEWNNAVTTDITYPGSTGPVTFYALNDAGALYVAVDDRRDASRQTNDTFGLFFDEDRNREWPTSSLSGEGLLQLFWNGTSAACAYQGLKGTWPGNVSGDAWATPSGVTQAVSASSGRVQYEGRISLSTFLQASPGSVLGMLLYVYEGQTGTFDGLWPQEVALKLPDYTTGYAWAHGPFSYGDFSLAIPSESAPIVVDGQKDALYQTLTGPDNGCLRLRSYAFNENGKPVNDADLSAKIWTAWDKEWFYLYEEVMDDTLSGNAVNVWEEDCLELNFDPQPTDSVNNSVWATRLTALGKAAAGVVVADSMNGVETPLKQWVRTQIPGGYALELALRWSAIRYGTETVSTSVGSLFGMAISQHDNDGKAKRQATVQWAAVLRDAVSNTPKYHGTVKFLADHKLQFVARNNMTGKLNPVPYDGSDYIPTRVKDVLTMASEGFSLEQNYPNPFNLETTIHYHLPEKAVIRMSICDLNGREIAVLADGMRAAGAHEVRWNGSDGSGNPMPSGLYLCRIQTGHYGVTRKLFLMK